MRNNKITGEQWQECDVCGFDYPKSLLRKQPAFQGPTDGFVVCPKCFDAPGHAYNLSRMDLPVEEVYQSVEGD